MSFCPNVHIHKEAIGMINEHNQIDKCKKGIWGKRIGVMLIGMLLLGGILFSIRPIRSTILTHAIKLLSYLDHSTLDETPNIKPHSLTIKVAELEDENENEEYDYITVDREKIYEGDLILVNEKEIYRFKNDDELVSIAKKKNNKYKLMDKGMLLSIKMVQSLNHMMTDFEKYTGKHDMIITSAYRSLEEQNEALEEKINEFGEEDALKWVMLPGYSEHHTGYAVDMSIRTDDGVYIPYKGQNDYSWINKNCFKYGIVRRYTEDKVAITGISNEPWHYRYVGIPHAYLMTIHDFCLEEYIAYLRQFSFDEEHLVINTEEGNYEVYYVAAHKTGNTDIPVPKNRPYSISGNNIDGFIVTVYLRNE